MRERYCEIFIAVEWKLSFSKVFKEIILHPLDCALRPGSHITFLSASVGDRFADTRTRPDLFLKILSLRCLISRENLYSKFSA